MVLGLSLLLCALLVAHTSAFDGSVVLTNSSFIVSLNPVALGSSLAIDLSQLTLSNGRTFISNTITSMTLTVPADAVAVPLSEPVPLYPLTLIPETVPCDGTETCLGSTACTRYSVMKGAPIEAYVPEGAAVSFAASAPDAVEAVTASPASAPWADSMVAADGARVALVPLSTVGPGPGQLGMSNSTLRDGIDCEDPAAIMDMHVDLSSPLSGLATVSGAISAGTLTPTGVLVSFEIIVSSAAYEEADALFTTVDGFRVAPSLLTSAARPVLALAIADEHASFNTTLTAAATTACTVGALQLTGTLLSERQHALYPSSFAEVYYSLPAVAPGTLRCTVAVESNSESGARVLPVEWAVGPVESADCLRLGKAQLADLSGCGLRLPFDPMPVECGSLCLSYTGLAPVCGCCGNSTGSHVNLMTNQPVDCGGGVSSSTDLSSLPVLELAKATYRENTGVFWTLFGVFDLVILVSMVVLTLCVGSIASVVFRSKEQDEFDSVLRHIAAIDANRGLGKTQHRMTPAEAFILADPGL
ncbi:hypothetical protein J8273_1606 [Carpediemonas membranifera]|uniref:Uncharacterized protein n=1 Tax=Carpediemonas membranifera TaxID=201153 RepID=A0A8J6BFU5_9EUKA|nr:hypothetical protein J8273_1606 [Carpediemonas membranifera]|eukprot:KAG9396597.1 hypothetical protein J8273_1606 [Carpediemonas membranifera]